MLRKSLLALVLSFLITTPGLFAQEESEWGFITEDDTGNIGGTETPIVSSSSRTRKSTRFSFLNLTPEQKPRVEAIVQRFQYETKAKREELAQLRRKHKSSREEHKHHKHDKRKKHKKHKKHDKLNKEDKQQAKKLTKEINHAFKKMEHEVFKILTPSQKQLWNDRKHKYKKRRKKKGHHKKHKQNKRKRGRNQE